MGAQRSQCAAGSGFLGISSAKGGNRRRRRRKVAPTRVAGGSARTQIMIAVGGPGEANGRREGIALDLGAAAERIAVALNNERGTAQALQVRRAQLGGSVGW